MTFLQFNPDRIQLCAKNLFCCPEVAKYTQIVHCSQRKVPHSAIATCWLKKVADFERRVITGKNKINFLVQQAGLLRNMIEKG